jgi:transposase
MQEDQRRAAKGLLIALMQAGHPWHEAAAMAGMQIGRLAAYQLLCNVRLRGEAALQDGRHGHPAKLRPPVREFLETTCREAPHIPSHVIQAVLHERFGLLVSIGHRKPVYSEALIPRGLVGRLSTVLGCRALVLLHDEDGHPLLATTHRGDQHLIIGLPSIVTRYEQ